MTIEQLHSAMKYAETKPTLLEAYSDASKAVNDFAVSRCAHPVTIRAINCDDGLSYPLEVGCGSCDTCRDRYRDEWVTRLCLESQEVKNVYFLTLTYQSFKHFANIPKFLHNAFWHYDNVNTNKRYAYNPCIVRLEHLQYFFRNLRNDLRNHDRDYQLKYFACGEYGKEYSRPHFHCLIFTNEDLTIQDFYKAWSFRIGRKHMHNFPIGHIDCIHQKDFKSRKYNIEGTSMSSISDVFKYVAKYVNKKEFHSCSRLNYVIDAILSDDYYFELYSREIFNERIIRKCSASNYEILKNILNNPHLNDYTSWYKGFYRSFTRTDGQFRDFCKDIASQGLNNFVSLFRPFVTCSRAQGFGALYAKRNVERMAQGNFNISSSTFGSLILPRYFVRKTKEYLCGLEFHSKLDNSVSYSKQNRPYIIDNLQEYLLNFPDDSFSENFVSNKNPFECSPKELSDLLRSRYSMRDANSGLRYLLYTQDHFFYDFDNGFEEFVQNNPTLQVGAWKYNRHTREYDFVDTYELNQFLSLFIEGWHKSKNFNANIYDKLYNDHVMLQSAIKICDCICQENGTHYRNLYFSAKKAQFEKNDQIKQDNYTKFNKKIF